MLGSHSFSLVVGHFVVVRIRVEQQEERAYKNKSAEKMQPHTWMSRSVELLLADSFYAALVYTRNKG